MNPKHETIEDAIAQLTEAVSEYRESGLDAETGVDQGLDDLDLGSGPETTGS
jgi:phage tail tube protein FII